MFENELITMPKPIISIGPQNRHLGGILRQLAHISTKIMVLTQP